MSNKMEKRMDGWMVFMEDCDDNTRSHNSQMSHPPHGLISEGSDQSPIRHDYCRLQVF
jgi:hypothetical protein